MPYSTSTTKYYQEALSSVATEGVEESKGRTALLESGGVSPTTSIFSNVNYPLRQPLLFPGHKEAAFVITQESHGRPL